MKGALSVENLRTHSLIEKPLTHCRLEAMALRVEAIATNKNTMKTKTSPAVNPTSGLFLNVYVFFPKALRRVLPENPFFVSSSDGRDGPTSRLPDGPGGSFSVRSDMGATRTLLGAKGIASSNRCHASSNKDATRGSWHRY